MLLLVQVGICTFMFYPLFFSLATRYKFVGAVTGIVLSLYKLVSHVPQSTFQYILHIGVILYT